MLSRILAGRDHM